MDEKVVIEHCGRGWEGNRLHFDESNPMLMECIPGCQQTMCNRHCLVFNPCSKLASLILTEIGIVYMHASNFVSSVVYNRDEH